MHDSEEGRFLTEDVGKETCHKVWFGEAGPRPKRRWGTSSCQRVIEAQGESEEYTVGRKCGGLLKRWDIFRQESHSPRENDVAEPEKRKIPAGGEISWEDDLDGSVEASGDFDHDVVAKDVL